MDAKENQVVKDEVFTQMHDLNYTLTDEVRPSRRDMNYGMPCGYSYENVVKV